MDSFTTKLTIGLMRGIGLLPLKASRLLGRALGATAYNLNTRSAQVTRKNVSICLPHIKEQAQEHFVKASLKETAKTAAEVCWVWHRQPKKCLKYLEEIEGEQHILDALKLGKGILILAPHLGNWELLGLQLSEYAQVTNLYQPPRKIGFEKFLIKNRTKRGEKLVPTNAKGVASLLKALKNNEICGILPDQNPNTAASGAFVPFFGEPAFTMTLVHKLISRTKCQAIFAFAKRTPRGFKIVFRPAPDAIYSSDQAASLRGLNSGIENLVREAPEQYQWEYKRFKVHNPQRPVKHYG